MPFAASPSAEALARYTASLAALRKAAPMIPLRERIALDEAVAFGSRGFSLRRHRTRHVAGVTRGAVGTLYRVAAVLCARDDNAFAPLGMAARAHVLEHLVPFLAYQSQGRSAGSSLALKARAAGFALLLRLAEAMAEEGERHWREVLLDWLLAAVPVEPHQGLRLQMSLGIDGLPAAIMTELQQTQARAAVELVRPSAPPYAQWFARGRRRLSVVQYIQDEFWREELDHYRDSGFTVERTGPDEGRATKRLPARSQAAAQEQGADGSDASAKESGGVTISVQLLMSDKDVLRPMRDPRVNMVLYSGHANVGGVALEALATAPDPAPGTKLIGFLACRTKQSLPSLQRRYPTMQFLVSDHATYGSDDRTVIQQLLHGVVARASYADISREIETHDLVQLDNYLFPSQLRALAHSDYDADGVIDLSAGRRDVLYHVPSRKGARRSISFRAKRGGVEPTALDGGPVADAVQWFNSVYAYHVQDFGDEAERARIDRFIADGWFEPADGDGPVRVTEVAGPAWRVSVDAGYGHQSPHAVAMLVTYHVALHVYAELQPDEGLHQRRMRALAMAVSYAVNLVEHSDEADDLLRTFAKRFGFPAALDYQVAYRAIMSDYEHEASPEIIRQLELGMQYPFLEVNDNRSDAGFRRYVQQALDKLRDSPSAIGQATFELIVTGRVKLDELRDVTVADYQRLRRELLRDGVELPEGGFMELHDAKNNTLRAITGIDGYMWDNRIYIARDHEPDELVATLVHEVNHVLNRSEEHYRSDKAVLREEYRAALAERMLHAPQLSAEAYRALKQQVIDSYGLNDVTPDDVADVPEGRYLPTDG